MGSTVYFIIVIFVLAMIVLRNIFLDDQKEERDKEADVTKALKNIESNINQKIKMNQTSRLPQKNVGINTRTNLRAINEDIEPYTPESDKNNLKNFEEDILEKKFTNGNIIENRDDMPLHDHDIENEKKQENTNFSQDDKITDSLLPQSDITQEQKGRTLTTRRFKRDDILGHKKNFTTKIQSGVDEIQNIDKDEAKEIGSKDNSNEKFEDENLSALEEDFQITSSFIKKIESIRIPVNYEDNVLSSAVAIQKSYLSTSNIPRRENSFNENKRVTTMLEMFEKNYD